MFDNLDTGACIVLAGSLAEYLEGGGYWWHRLQYLLGLRALGHEVFWLDLLPSTGDRDEDHRLVEGLLERMRAVGLADRTIILLHPGSLPNHDSESFTLLNASERRFDAIVRDADVLWNLCGAAKQPLLSRFKRRALIDLDPGVYQVSAATWDMGLDDHEVFFTLGAKVGDDDCEIPDAGVTWRPITPFVFLPMWGEEPDPGPGAPFTSLTQWEWREMWLGDRVLSRSKREAYLRYLDLPARTGVPFELAANIDPGDDTGDRELLASHGWNWVHPHVKAGTPADYRRYIAGSRAEFLCPKPIYADLRTGWFSDRSACYLATGRPVVCEDTGFSDRIPTGAGVLAFRDFDEAVAAVGDVHADYARHKAAARELAIELFDSRARLTEMVEASFASPPAAADQSAASASDAARSPDRTAPSM
jgi:hypothetical protein